ncbi:hypothetical protein K0M31_006351 [Melipona bicolor]|uniref:Uncharacterized protein n=1 Tax=Melipona bicolor TaxID=60889 RepID=A0AA40FTI2_9HYME|nr:hypothetical protein K0M31_006351 [Melipona bicolor]
MLRHSTTPRGQTVVWRLLSRPFRLSLTLSLSLLLRFARNTYVNRSAVSAAIVSRLRSVTTPATIGRDRQRTGNRARLCRAPAMKAERATPFPEEKEVESRGAPPPVLACACVCVRACTGRRGRFERKRETVARNGSSSSSPPPPFSLLTLPFPPGSPP